MKKKAAASIRTNIIILILSVVLCLSLALGTVACVLTYRSSIQVLEETIQETASIACGQVAAEIRTYLSIVDALGMQTLFADTRSSQAQKKVLLDEVKAKYNLVSCNLLNPIGRSVFEDLDLSDREYFKQAKAGNTYISDPIISKLTGEITLVAAAPLWENGKVGTQTVGVISAELDKEFLNNIVRSVQIGDCGGAYIINRNGDLIADTDSARVLQVNMQELEKTEPDRALQAEIERHMMNQESGLGTLTSFDGKKLVVAYAPLGINGWSVGVYADQDDFLTSAKSAVLLTIVIVLAFILIGTLIAVRYGHSIANPIRACAVRLEQLAEGDLHTGTPQINSLNEIGVLADATEKIVTNLQETIKDEVLVLDLMAKGDLSASPQITYIGDFAPLRKSIETILVNMNQTLAQINTAANQVASGSGQVSSGAQALSQGATEQASSVQELAATISEISGKTDENSQDASTAGEEVTALGLELRDSSSQMNEMISAMKDISSFSDQIGNIIKTIEDIAFQTNILALNAAVEAARAGAAGKGFAVVADEVRNLAGKSSEAAKGTSTLIANTIRAVQNGTQIAGGTAQSLDKVVERANGIVSIVERIRAASAEQAASVGQITMGVEQISSVVQTNSATAEESAAAAQELSSQAEMLKQLVAQFRLHSQVQADQAVPPAGKAIAPPYSG